MPTLAANIMKSFNGLSQISLNPSTTSSCTRTRTASCLCNMVLDQWGPFSSFRVREGEFGGEFDGEFGGGGGVLKRKRVGRVEEGGGKDETRTEDGKDPRHHGGVN